jgi:hypothetical protein
VLRSSTRGRCIQPPALRCAATATATNARKQTSKQVPCARRAGVRLRVPAVADRRVPGGCGGDGARACAGPPAGPSTACGAGPPRNRHAGAGPPAGRARLPPAGRLSLGSAAGAMCAAHRTRATSSASSLRRCTTGGSTRRARWRRSRCGHAATISACADRSNRTVTHRHRPGSAGVPVSTAGRSVCPTACTGVGRCGACCGSA